MTGTGTIDLTDLDLFETERHHEAFDWLRANDPVHWNPTPDGSGFWALTRYDDLVTAYREHSTFSSAGGAVLGGSIGGAGDSATGLMLVASDPPRQRQLRQVLHQAFTAPVLDAIAERVAELVDRAIDTTLTDGGCDFAVDVAPELPAGALMAMMSLTHDEARHLVDLTRRMIGFNDPLVVGGSGHDRLGLAETQAEIFDFFADLLPDRRYADGRGLLGMLLRAKVNGHPLSEEEILYNCMNVAVGGNETSSYTACAGLRALIEHPEQWELLRRSAVTPTTAINEMLRWASTNAYVQRVAKHDFTFGATTIRAGDAVTLWNVSANRDEARFPEPHRFDLTRTSNRHLSYGSGIHRCIGAQVAHAELSSLFGRLIRDEVRFEFAGEVRRLRSNFILGMTRLPITVAGRR
ncbi:cytochrome [Saccharothrix sp. ALI-22-I]|uniref:cytochrome P450 n=1 Tax=Saccharothrix sp. ALI-22-I TaxID=1933778 RepID=UPI00097C2F73|nr:cytochrome P450 [Saccharothrix sp. ALI-22-I]ONI91294.1 cytochrome [Saccharothrix sp. ALI-22-I]